MLGQYGPDLLITCRHASDLAEELVRQWLALYMFRGARRREERASKVAKWLATHSNFKSHGRPIPRQELEKQGLRIVPLEADQDAQDLFLSIYHTTSHTFSETGAAKIIENHNGRAFMKLTRQIVVQAQGPAQRPQPPPGNSRVDRQ
jgi:hypothetical protein